MVRPQQRPHFINCFQWKRRSTKKKAAEEDDRRAFCINAIYESLLLRWVKNVCDSSSFLSTSGTKILSRKNISKLPLSVFLVSNGHCTHLMKKQKRCGNLFLQITMLLIDYFDGNLFELDFHAVTELCTAFENYCILGLYHCVSCEKRFGSAKDGRTIICLEFDRTSER